MICWKTLSWVIVRLSIYLRGVINIISFPLISSYTCYVWVSSSTLFQGYKELMLPPTCDQYCSAPRLCQQITPTLHFFFLSSWLWQKLTITHWYILTFPMKRWEWKENKCPAQARAPLPSNRLILLENETKWLQFLSVVVTRKVAVVTWIKDLTATKAIFIKSNAATIQQIDVEKINHYTQNYGPFVHN